MQVRREYGRPSHYEGNKFNLVPLLDEPGPKTKLHCLSLFWPNEYYQNSQVGKGQSGQVCARECYARRKEKRPTTRELYEVLYLTD